MQAASSSPLQYRPPRVDIYTVLLAIALVAVIIGCVFLYLEVADYGSPPYPEGGVVLNNPAVRAISPALEGTWLSPLGELTA
ncbi:hypothetical protein [Thermogutta terrifontis]|uniref:hypothetical protein n=1 Tax=Thermogutta terrifontis TaxID=1331910 RepID=UPI000BA8C058|nr:hypothetical protein [Thermogutta terrifontis]